MKQAFSRIRRFFYEHPLGATLVVVVCVKLFVMFVILRIFFFQPALSGMDDGEKAEHVAERISNR